MSNPRPASQDSNIVETLQSLVVAFVLAMAFRGFVLEGFVIPTGSMAPTLMGQHLRFRSPATGYEYPLDAGPLAERFGRPQVDPRQPVDLVDPMLSPTRTVVEAPAGALMVNARMGDRVLVLKSVYKLFAPRRFDVVVFKNPTDPVGETQNYIKRLIGLPGERILLADGDVFAGPADGTSLADMRVQRKPEHVQRAVWQVVHDMDYVPIDLAALEARTRQSWPALPWIAPGWSRENPRVLRWNSPGTAQLSWDAEARPIDDWTAYNVLRGVYPTYPVSDLRISTALSADVPSALVSTLEISARAHVFQFRIADGEATVSIRHLEGDGEVHSARAPIDLPRAGGAVDVEFWHVDQALSIWIDGDRVVELEYDWSPQDRLRYAMNGRTLEQYARDPLSQRPTPPTIAWSLEGSPVTLERLRLDRDLYYRPARLNPNDQFSVNGEIIQGLAEATDPFHPLVLTPDQYFMLGDNSPASRDGRMWGRPHPLVALNLDDDAPFVVDRRLLLGKAWAVYFPAPLPLSPGGRALVPDFGRLRFIR